MSSDARTDLDAELAAIPTTLTGRFDRVRAVRDDIDRRVKALLDQLTTTSGATSE